MRDFLVVILVSGCSSLFTLGIARAFIWCVEWIASHVNPRFRFFLFLPLGSIVGLLMLTALWLLITPECKLLSTPPAKKLPLFAFVAIMSIVSIMPAVIHIIRRKDRLRHAGYIP